MTRRCIIFAVLAVLWCGTIFMLSGEKAEESSETSGFFVDLVCDIFVPDLDELPEDRQAEIKDNITFVIRKGAHFTAYGILGAFSFGAFGFIKRRKLRAAAAVGFAALYSVSDEIHQSFVGGRSCEVRDMLIDTCGALTFVLIILLIIRITDKKRTKSEAAGT